MVPIRFIIYVLIGKDLAILTQCRIAFFKELDEENFELIELIGSAFANPCSIYYHIYF